jgi:hypothetical protein
MPTKPKPKFPWPLKDAKGKPRPIATFQDCETLNRVLVRLVTQGRLTPHFARTMRSLLNSWKLAHRMVQAEQRKW